MAERGSIPQPARARRAVGPWGYFRKIEVCYDCRNHTYRSGHSNGSRL